MDLQVDFPRAKPGQMHGNWCCIDDDPVTGIAEWAWLEKDVSGEIVRMHYKRIQHNSDLLFRENKFLFNESQGQRWGDGKVVSSIPMNIFEGALGEAAAAKDNKYIRKFLNDPDNRKFRTFEGNL